VDKPFSVLQMKYYVLFIIKCILVEYLVKTGKAIPVTDHGGP
jgi:hypothetical protein